MKRIVHHFHSHPPHHGSRYYCALAGVMFAVALGYVVIKIAHQWA